MFVHRTLKAQATPRHEIELVAGGHKLKVRVLIFGREQWTLNFDVLKDGKPARLDDYRLLVVNDCCPRRKPSVRVLESQPQGGGIGQ